MIGETIAFWVLAVVVVIAALMVVLLRNVFRAALALVLCFLMVAGLYVTLSADFLAAIQILVYVGAISVLIILSIMMTHDVTHGSQANRLKAPALIVAVVMLGVLIYTVTGTAWKVANVDPNTLLPTTGLLAGKLFADNGFILPVEIAALLLLAAVIGAMVLARDK
jgi:NADH:ubiquinone oxidoreductase subunit 6 (subunit J)